MADLRLPRVNKFIVSGRIANDLELKFTPKGTPVLRLTLATDRSYKDDSDQWQTVTSWIDCVAWAKNAESITNNAHKGSALLIEGRVDTRTWTDPNNVNRKITEVTIDYVHFLEWKPRDGQESASDNDVPLPPEEMASTSTKTTNDDVPF
ncbi:MAG: single-stranded DNA-binding protein [Candidatus Cloacimonadaceae bacterium]|jgi:single-strand DNA-binding protein|nr:single-stranded DNA-binding protein [Candidatus Cloacimonadota bacterium]MDY0127240.1 single-stranded DNA-binding protein [Candidatus Cloacimonadaceae bacterium]MCB5254515.1 single-stranded DNA-binding protein [Candidatus Cloacimonadota bacterium]MCK9178268.1 single-stranded DNA-binding protein [Candidatus Cloacimonadota bacterium]MCK9242856.1 single-stranded DNA-binding protein [Candidatus Cloacimonadota bacterium]